VDRFSSLPWPRMEGNRQAIPPPHSRPPALWI